MLYVAFVVFAVLFVAYANGANDNFKGVATLFGSGTTGYRGALAWGTLTTFAGSITAVLVFLYSMYLYASAILLGGEVAAAWSRPPVPATEPLPERIKGMVTGLFMARKEPVVLPEPDDGPEPKPTERS